MTIETCVKCDLLEDTSIHCGAYDAIEYGYCEYICESCDEARELERQSLESAQEDYFKAKRRGEL